MAIIGTTRELQESFTDLQLSGSLTSPIISGATLATTSLQAGTGVLSSGSKWVAFGTAYGSTPTVVTTAHNAPVNWDVKFRIGEGSVNAGSFLATGSHATGSFAWMSFA